MKTVILAGGKGTRLGALTEQLPKPMVPIGGRPILEHQLRLLRRHGLCDIILSIGHLADHIAGHFGSGRKLGVSLGYVRETEPLGTAGALKAMEAELTEDFLVLYGDVMLDIDLGRLLAFHREKAGAGTLVLHPNDHPMDSDLVEIDADSRRILAFHPKPHPPGKQYRNLVNAGACVLSPRVFRHIDAGARADLGRDVFPRIVDREQLYGYVTAEYLKDMGTPERLREVTEDYLAGRVQRFNSRQKRRAIFLDRDGVINRLVGLLHRPGDLELLPGVARGIRAINASEFLAVVVTNQPVVARNLCSLRELDAIHGRMEALLAAEGAKVDALYYCPHHPDKGYAGENPAYKVPCRCRKPDIGMIERAAEELNIDLKGSCIIGDSARDIECGRRAGLETVAVMTGERWTTRDGEPDYVFASFAEAVEFVLTEPFQPCFLRIYEDFLRTVRRGPFLITIDGDLTPDARNFANYFARAFRKEGRSVARVSFNDWAAPETAAIEEVLAACLPGGKPARRGPDVVLIDGPVPPALARLREQGKFRIYCEMGEDRAAARLESFLAWRGFDAREIEGMRKAQERNRSRAARDADLVIALREERPAHDHHAYAVPG